ncbi:hypothetical protein [Dehalogenimonas etheniformans]|uniref:Uncharacterized protein n=1 Tax=Dehalogenimonas etheniformans TaxID=1536648 RepID=A0A2P5P4R1_9CHLR|nr:hypothetical protein [Dehalogenimonas etheniformans]PPD57280.1 hypothetical protein JP09_009525 [Dehalogenimonas etheniformans]QNT76996.1 hypothetical protein HX448_10080 [Dehalogenimonas etheniformans]
MKNSNMAAVVYTGLSLLAAALFIVATISGDYSSVAMIGGAVWVFILSMIILMPPVSGAFKKRGR